MRMPVSLKNISLSSVSLKDISMSGTDEPSLAPLVIYDSLKSDGVAYINTGITPSATNKYEIATYITNTTRSYYMGAYRFGCDTQYLLYRGGAFRLPFVANAINVLTISPDKITYRVGETITEITPTNTQAMAGPIWLFGRWDGGYHGNGSHKIHRFCNWDENGVLLHYLLPCKCFGVPGMYDIVNKVFYGNANTEGEFTVEGEGYEVEFYDRLITDGTAYVIADTPVTKQYSFEANFSVPVSNTGYTLFGSKRHQSNGVDITEQVFKGGGSTTSRLQIACTCAGASSYVNSLVSGYTAQDKFGVLCPVKYDYSGSGDSSLYVSFRQNGTEIANTKYPGSAYPTDYAHLGLFALPVYNTDGSLDVVQNIAESGAIIRSVIIRHGDTEVYNFLPCKCGGEAGVFDVVNKVFYGNSNGEGTFTLAND